MKRPRRFPSHTARPCTGLKIAAIFGRGRRCSSWARRAARGSLLSRSLLAWTREVVAAGTSDEKLKVCADRGAAQLLNLTGVDVKEAVRALNGGKGPEVIYDCIGGPYAEPALRGIAWGGRYLVVGFAAGDIPKIPLNLVLLKGCEIAGVFWGRHVALEPPRLSRSDGPADPVVHRGQDPAAYRSRVLSRRNGGRVARHGGAADQGQGRREAVMQAGPRHLFVYGTLMRASRSPYAQLLRARAQFVGEGWTPGRLYHLGRYPGAVFGDDCTNRVHGELFLLRSDTLLVALDAYEGCGGERHEARSVLSRCGGGAARAR